MADDDADYDCWIFGLFFSLNLIKIDFYDYLFRTVGMLSSYSRPFAEHGPQYGLSKNDRVFVVSLLRSLSSSK